MNDEHARALISVLRVIVVVLSSMNFLLGCIFVAVAVK